MSLITSRKRVVAFIFSLLFLSSCGSVDKAGYILLLDDSYSASIFGTTAKDGLGFPDGLMLAKGNLYVNDEGRGTVTLWGKDGGKKVLCDRSVGIRTPEDLVMDADGNIFFTDDDAGGLWEVDAQKSCHLVAGKEKGLISTEGIALNSDGAILVGDGQQHEVFRVTKQGDVSIFLGPEYGIKKPESMVFDESGNLFIADNSDNVLYLLNKQHELEVLVDGRRGGVLSPETLFYSRGVLYITDGITGKLSSYTMKQGLKPIAAFGGPLKNIQGVAVDEGGDVYLSVQSDYERNIGYIVKLTKQGGSKT